MSSYEEHKAVRIAWFWEVVSAAAAAIGRAAAGQVWDANRRRDTLDEFAWEAAQAVKITSSSFSELRESDEWHQLEEGLFTHELPSENGPETPDPELSKRATARSDWLDQKLRQHPDWSSDIDIAEAAGRAYNTIQRYRSGATSTRELYVRRGLAKAFQYEITEVPE